MAADGRREGWLAAGAIFLLQWLAVLEYLLLDGWEEFLTSPLASAAALGLGALAVVGLYVGRFFVTPPPSRRAAWLLTLLLLWGFWNVLSLLWSPQPGETLRAGALLFFALLNAFLLGPWLSGPPRRGLIWAMVLLALSQALVGLAQVLGGSPTPGAWVDAHTSPHLSIRATGTLFDPNRLAAYLLGALPFAWALAATATRPIGRVAGWVSGTGILVGLLVTYSRAAYLGLGGAGLVGVSARWVRGSLSQQQPFNRWPHIFWGGIGLGALVATLCLTPIGARLRSMAQWQDTSFQSRLLLWRECGRIIADHPVRGVGLDAFKEVRARYDTAATRPLPCAQTHNLWLHLLVELGGIGTGLFVALLILWAAVIRQAWPELASRPWRLAAGASVGGLLLMGLFDNPLYIRDRPSLGLFWFALALPAAAEERTGEPEGSREGSGEEGTGREDG